MFNADYPAAMMENGAIQVAAHTFGLEVTPYGIRQTDDINPAFNALKGHADALYIVDDSLVVANSRLIASSALTIQMPTISGTPTIVQADGLMSYGPNIESLFQRAAEMHRAADLAHDCRRGDRMKRREFITLSGVAAVRHGHDAFAAAHWGRR
jgi:ABC-type uncharacterized transport system substrate-binding protein